MMMKMRMISNEANSSRICIDSYEEDIPTGRIYHVSQEFPIHFTGWMSMIKLLNQLMDQNDFPQLGMQLRTFQTRPENENCIECQKREMNGTTNEWMRGVIATFRLRVMFRQNATWQGIVRWGERGKEMRFRSVLELMMLMDSCFTKNTTLLDIQDQTESVVG